MSALQVLQPPGWARAKGFSNGIACKGRLVFIAGQVGWTGQGEWKEKSFAGQFRQALQNILDVLKEAQGRPEHEKIWHPEQYEFVNRALRKKEKPLPKPLASGAVGA